MSRRPIADYAFLSDCNSAALVSGHGSVDWLCLPRFDDPSIFGRLLDPDGGHWSIRPAGDHETRRRYLADSLVVETQFATPEGMVMLTDALVFDAGERGHEIGLNAPHVLVRVLEATQGAPSMAVEFAPRPEYGLVRPWLQFGDGAVVARGGGDVLVLAGPPPTLVEDATARWELIMHAGERVAFALHYGVGWRQRPEPWSQRQIRKRLGDTVAAWRSWALLHQSYEGPWRDLVNLSARVLQGLTFQPTGAVVAAPTTSLPGTVGGSRNWDYRYGRVRDAGPTFDALRIAACAHEAERFVAWILNAAGSWLEHEAALQATYGVGGEHDLWERELPHLRGWRDSRPVRVGNGVWSQPQLDVSGALLDAAHRLSDRLGEFDERTAELLAAVADAAAARWREPDHGIWEARGEARQFLYSKVLCWVALDRAVRLAEPLRRADRVVEWNQACDEISAAVLGLGWSETLDAYTQALEGEALDASVLLLAISGFLPATDRRMRATIERLVADLSAPCGLLFRYRNDDGLPGDEGAFLPCTYWLAQCWALAGEPALARDVFEHATAYANDVGLLSEEADPQSGELLGNFPHAPSHIGLVNAARAIAHAEAAQA